MKRNRRPRDVGHDREGVEAEFACDQRRGAILVDHRLDPLVPSCGPPHARDPASAGDDRHPSAGKARREQLADRVAFEPSDRSR